MLPIQPIHACHYCPDHATYRLVFLDDAEVIGACRAHFADAYDHAERANTRAFLPVHIARTDALVAA